jgi:hypothetical protein
LELVVLALQVLAMQVQVLPLVLYSVLLAAVVEELLGHLVLQIMVAVVQVVQVVVLEEAEHIQEEHRNLHKEMQAATVTRTQTQAAGVVVQELLGVTLHRVLVAMVVLV